VRHSENGGFRPLDQPEAAAVAAHMARLHEGGRFAFYLTFHTAVHSIVVPWSAFAAPRAIPQEHEAVYQEVIAWVHGHTTYDAGRNGWFDESANLGYAASGTSQDWAYHCCDIPSMTFETFHFAEGVSEDVNWWGADVLPITLKLLLNTDHLKHWEPLEREFPYPPEWEGVHWFAEGAPEQGDGPRGGALDAPAGSMTP
jgi:hypothetical protein